MSVTEEQVLGSVTTLLSTELNSLASSSGFTAGAISSVGGSSGLFNNTIGGGGFGGYLKAQAELYIASPAGTLTAGTIAAVWFIQNVDGTYFEDGSGSVIPARPPDVTFPVRAVSTAQRIVRNCLLPPGNWYVLLSHNTGQTWASSGNTVKVLPVTFQGN